MSKRELISKNFYLDEFTYSPTAVVKGIVNVPNTEQIQNIKHIVKTIIQPVRDHYARMVTINSGFRCSELNKVVGGAVSSQHTLGEAVDFEISGIANKEVAEWVVHNLPFDQVILEFYNPMEGVNSGWVHVSCKRTGINRGKKLVAYKDGKSTRYEAVTDFSKVK